MLGGGEVAAGGLGRQVVVVFSSADVSRRFHGSRVWLLVLELVAF